MFKMNHGRSAKYEDIINKAWEDEAFLQQLQQNPAEALATMGVTIPAGLEVKVVTETSSLAYLVIPAKPDSPDVTHEW